MPGLTGPWRRFHTIPWYGRWAIKWAILGLTILFVTFPYPHLLVRNVRRWRNPNAIIDPDAPELQPMVGELKALLDPEYPPRKALRTVEQYVNRKIAYAWDWETWGVADYLPTVAEVIAVGREDCDGRAVVAAALLRNLGYRAELVSDFAHVWVRTDKGETMSPGRRKSVVATRTGVEVRWRTLGNLPRALATGIAPFPWERELIVLAVLWLLLLCPGVGRLGPAVGGVLLVSGLVVVRRAGQDLRHPIVWMQLCGVALAVAAGLLLSVQAWRASRQGTACSAASADVSSC